jgi:hypothetical protein
MIALSLLFKFNSRFNMENFHEINCGKMNLDKKINKNEIIKFNLICIFFIYFNLLFHTAYTILVHVSFHKSDTISK